MYKLIIGNVRVSVLDDGISRTDAAAAAKKAIAAASRQGKLLSLVEVSAGSDGLAVKSTEKVGSRSARKTIKQSMLDGAYSAIREKFNPSGTFTQKDVWYDSDTGQEWTGEAVQVAREELLLQFENWKKTIQ